MELVRPVGKCNVSPTLACFHWLHVKSMIMLNNQAHSYFKDLIVPYDPNGALCSQTAYLWFLVFSTL